MKRATWLLAIGLTLSGLGCSSSKDPNPVTDGGVPDAGHPHPDAGQPDAGPQLGDDWTQWGHDARHSGSAGIAAQPFNRVLAQITFDPFVAAEQAEGGGDLFAHYPVPLLVGDDVYLMEKTGNYIPCEPPGSGALADGGYYCGAVAWQEQVWNLSDYRWDAQGHLNKVWSFQSDWKPPTGYFTNWEPPFQSAVAGDVIYVPGASGSVYKLDRHTGAQLAQLMPFTADPSIYVAGGLAASPGGDVFYNAMQLDPNDAWGNDANGWLVKLSADGGVSSASYTDLAVGAPATGDLCSANFNRSNAGPQPYPPPPDAGLPVPVPQRPCGTQRPSLGLVPAIAPDGTVYTVSRAHFVARYSYLVAVNPDLSPKWAASFRDRLSDGCGFLEPSDSPLALADGGVINSHCRVGATPGVDPFTNEQPAPWADDSSSSSPVVLPDGNVVYGALTQYNTSRGHLLEFSPAGAYLGNFDFGWDVTPAYFEHDGTYSLVTKDNHYYNWDQSAPSFYISRLDHTLNNEWSYQSTNTLSCTRLADGGSDCIDDGQHATGFEWCINAPAVDPAGNVLVNSEDGHLYKIDNSGHLADGIMLKIALGAAYTPLAIDDKGRTYSLNGGDLFVIGQ